MKKILKICLYILIYTTIIFFVSLSFSVVVDSVNRMHSQYIAGHFDLSWWNFIKYLLKKPMSFKYYGKLLLVSLSNIIFLLIFNGYITYKVSPIIKQKVNLLKNKYLFYKINKLESKKEKIADKIIVLNKEKND